MTDTVFLLYEIHAHPRDVEVYRFRWQAEERIEQIALFESKNGVKPFLRSIMKIQEVEVK